MSEHMSEKVPTNIDFSTFNNLSEGDKKEVARIARERIQEGEKDIRLYQIVFGQQLYPGKKPKGEPPKEYKRKLRS